MIVYINGRFLTQKITGVQRFAREVVVALDNIVGSKNSNINFILLVPRRAQINIKYKNISIEKIGFFKGHVWEQVNLLLKTKNHLLLNFCNSAPAFKKKQVATIHDASIYAYKNNFSVLFLAWYRVLFWMIIRNSKNILTVSKFSHNELCKYTNIDSKKIKIVYEGCEHIHRIKSDIDVFEKHHVCKPYVLAVSSIDPRKNFINIIEAMKTSGAVNYNVIIAGSRNNQVFSKGKELSIPSSVKFIGYVTDEELKALYENAFCFIYPSLYEGFGLPPLEAMSVGCPVIVSKRASLPEICDIGAIYCDPLSPYDIRRKIDMLYKDANLQSDLKKIGFLRSKRFLWRRSAEKILDIVKKSE